MGATDADVGLQKVIKSSETETSTENADVASRMRSAEASQHPLGSSTSGSAGQVIVKKEQTVAVPAVAGASASGPVGQVIVKKEQTVDVHAAAGASSSGPVGQVIVKKEQIVAVPAGATSTPQSTALAVKKEIGTHTAAPNVATQKAPKLVAVKKESSSDLADSAATSGVPATPVVSQPVIVKKEAGVSSAIVKKDLGATDRPAASPPLIVKKESGNSGTIVKKQPGATDTSAASSQSESFPPKLALVKKELGATCAESASHQQTCSTGVIKKEVGVQQAPASAGLTSTGVLTVKRENGASSCGSSAPVGTQSAKSTEANAATGTKQEKQADIKQEADKRSPIAKIPDSREATLSKCMAGNGDDDVDSDEDIPLTQVQLATQAKTAEHPCVLSKKRPPADNQEECAVGNKCRGEAPTDQCDNKQKEDATVKQSKNAGGKGRGKGKRRGGAKTPNEHDAPENGVADASNSSSCACSTEIEKASREQNGHACQDCGCDIQHIMLNLPAKVRCSFCNVCTEKMRLQRGLLFCAGDFVWHRHPTKGKAQAGISWPALVFHVVFGELQEPRPYLVRRFCETDFRQVSEEDLTSWSNYTRPERLSKKLSEAISGALAAGAPCLADHQDHKGCDTTRRRDTLDAVEDSEPIARKRKMPCSATKESSKKRKEVLLRELHELKQVLAEINALEEDFVEKMRKLHFLSASRQTGSQCNIEMSVDAD